MRQTVDLEIALVLAAIASVRVARPGRFASSFLLDRRRVVGQVHLVPYEPGHKVRGRVVGNRFGRRQTSDPV